MAKGENIFKRKDGRWEARYVKGYELSGKIKYGFCYGKTYKEAKEKVSVLKAAVITGQALPETGSRHRLAFYCDEWLHSSRNRLKESTLVKYTSIVEKHIKPRLGSCCPQGISTETLEGFRDELLCEAGLSAKTVKDILVLLGTILKYTEKRSHINLPRIEMNYPREVKKEMRVLTKQEQKLLMEQLTEDMDECKFGVLLALYTGIRIGELCALRWEHISLQEATIKINATMQRLQSTKEEPGAKTRIIVDTPKSDTSMRTIPLTGQALDLCIRMYRQDKAVFILTGTHKYMEPRVLQYRLNKYTGACGLEGVHFHTLRHTFATRCVEVGFDVKSLSEILGHASTKITLDRYVHSSLELKRDNMNKLNTLGF